MAERKLQVLLKKIMANGDIDHIFFKSRAKDVMVDESGTQTLADIASKVNNSAEGATKVEDSSTNGNIKINGVEKNVYEHPTSGVTAGTYNSVTVNAQGHVTSASQVTDWTGTVSGNISNGTNTITQATTRANLTSGEKLSTSLGKIKKYFADLGSMAFTSSVGTSNLDSTLTTFYNAAITTDNVTESTSITAAGWVADARAIASLQNQINTINSNLTADGVGAVEYVDARGSSFDMDTIFKSGVHHRLYLCDGDTLNTPSDQGVVTFTSAYILSMASSTTFGVQYAFISGSKDVCIRRMTSGTIDTTWTKMTNEAILNDILAGYLPLSGGTLTNKLTIESSAFSVLTIDRIAEGKIPGIAFKQNGTLLGYIAMNASGLLGRYLPDGSTNYKILDLSNYSDYVIPLSGGIISGNIQPNSHMSINLGTSTNEYATICSRYFSTYDKFGNRTGVFYMYQSGTTDTEGITYCMIGNEIASGSEGNSKGRIRLFDNSTYYAQLQTVGDMTANRTFYFPDATGTILTTSSDNLTRQVKYTTANTNYSTFLVRGIASGTSSAPSSMVNGGVYLKYS